MDTAGSPKNNTPFAKRLTKKPWRIVATGLAFSLFGVGGPPLAAIMLILYPLPISIYRKRAWMRRCISSTFWIYVRLLRFLGLLTFSANNTGQFNKKGQLILANHPTLLDVVFVMSLASGANCVVKGALWRNPFTRWPVLAAGYIANDDPALIQKCKDCIARKENLIIFPEGTRSQLGKPLKFLRGAANIALAACEEVRPVLLTCKPPTLIKNQKWYSVPDTTPHFHIEVQPMLNIAKYSTLTRYNSKNVRVLCRDLENYYGELLRKPISKLPPI